MLSLGQVGRAGLNLVRHSLPGAHSREHAHSCARAVVMNEARVATDREFPASTLKRVKAQPLKPLLGQYPAYPLNLLKGICHWLVMAVLALRGLGLRHCVAMEGSVHCVDLRIVCCAAPGPLAWGSCSFEAAPSCSAVASLCSRGYFTRVRRLCTYFRGVFM